MKKNEINKSCIYIKQNKTNWLPVSKQTQLIRDKANNKIRELGDKYYNVKYLFEKLNLKRDELFNIGRELENFFKDKKKIDHLQTQARRMKECIIIWYTEYFYTEIFQPNSIVLQHLLGKIGHNKDNSSNSQCLDLEQNNRQNEKSNIPENGSLEIKTDITTFLNDIRFNKEIDHFDNTNHIYSQVKSDTNSIDEINMKFNYSQYFNF